MLLSEILGQDRAVALLRRALGRGPAGSRQHHAYLFAGPEGVGKRTTAFALAAAAVCTSEPGGGCGTCSACERALARNHPDVIVVEPDTSKANPVIRTAQIRDELLPRLGFRPHEAAERLVIIEGAETLHDVAANALLKTLEEPHDGTRFILLTSAPTRLPVTIRSRCQVVRFAPLSDAIVARILERNGMPAEEAARTAQLGDGSVARALAASADSDGAAAHALAERILAVVAPAEGDRLDAPSLLDVARDASAARTQLDGALELVRRTLRDALCVASGAPARVTVPDRAPVDRAARLGARGLLSAVGAIDRSREALVGNANAQLCMEDLLFRLRREARLGKRLDQ